MQTNEHYYSLTKDEYMSLSAGDMGTLDGLKMKAEYKVKQAYSALAEVIVAEESSKGE